MAKLTFAAHEAGLVFALAMAETEEEARGMVGIGPRAQVFVLPDRAEGWSFPIATMFLSLASDELKRLVANQSDGVDTYDASHSLGIHKMPFGYALMFSHNIESYYLLRWDGWEDDRPTVRIWKAWRRARAIAKHPNYNPWGVEKVLKALDSHLAEVAP